MIFWGPPGIGKTTLAMIISNTLHRPFHTLSAISSGVKEVREVINQAQQEEGSILFIDEIHRFNKAQQDSLLGAVERGIITLIGATTENPSFEVISALLSRCQVYVLRDFDEADMRRLIDSAVAYYATQGLNVEVREAEALMRISGGDARKLLNAIELVVNRNIQNTPNTPIILDNQSVTAAVQQNLAFYDKGGEMHYDIISAFIKSMRGSDPNGAVYWLARMIEGGRPPHAHLRLRGHRQRQPQRSPARQRHLRRREQDRLSRVPHQPLAVRLLPSLLGQEQRHLYGS